MAVVQYQTRLKEPRRGLCSSWLASLNPEQGDLYFWGWERPQPQAPTFPVPPATGAQAPPVSTSTFCFDLLHAFSLLQQDLSRCLCGCGLGALCSQRHQTHPLSW